MNLTALEQAILPIVIPGAEALWNSTLFPAIQKALQSASPEIQALESAIAAAVNSAVTGELQVLASRL